jgi:hypothetical protein
MAIPAMHSVESSCVARLGYDSTAEEVYVEFRDGDLYAYCRVPAEVYAEFEAAESRGTLLNTVIKPGYPVRKL